MAVRQGPPQKLRSACAFQGLNVVALHNDSLRLLRVMDNKNRKRLLDCADAQADLFLRRLHVHFGTFSPGHVSNLGSVP